jgi:GT2 family glycosyltransferase
VRPTASILIPTRRRCDYLAVALASVAGQAAEHGAEIIVVEDDPPDAATEQLAALHDARYIALGHQRGLNVARNSAAAAAAGDLFCYLDDDVAVWPQWLAAILAAVESHPDHEAFGGPIRAQLEGTNLHSCGREPAPLTTLDLGPDDRDAELVWGANLAIRRTTFQRVGAFDETRSGPGDEEEWERRLRAAGGRILYVAAAGVDHRRSGADARIAALSRAAWRRGRHSRRFDESKGTAPSLGRELRTLAGCAWHIARYRCGNGIVLSAQSAGRMRAALVRGSETTSTDPEYLSGSSGTLGRRGLLAGHARDAAAALREAPRRRQLRTAATLEPPRRRVHVAGVARPAHAAHMRRIRRELERSRHDITLQLEPGASGAGKWANLGAMLRERPLGDADWLLLVDDDVVLPRGFLDLFLLAAERAGLKLAQPAHAFASHAAWPVTRRQVGLMARRTRFVEIGPVTALHSDAFAVLLPFPELAMGWGLDAHWSARAADAGLPLGIVDLTPVRHLLPVASAYPRAAATAEAEAFLAGRPYVTRAQAAEVLATYPPEP